jgi:hypothetical protein
MPSIWSDTYLNQLLDDAAHAVTSSVPCLSHRFYLATTSGLSVYTLPAKVNGIKRITWRGIELWPMSWQEMEQINPGLAYVNTGTRMEGTSSRPQYYALHPTNILDIRFYPTPSESFSATGGDPYSPQVNEERCTISCWRNIDTSDPTASLPTYIDRRTRKAYVLWRAFGKEGKGQNSRASLYYKQKYQYLINSFGLINAGCFTSTRYTLGDELPASNRKPAKPTLGPNFERVRF